MKEEPGMVHRLKTLKQFYRPFIYGYKTFEVRNNDRQFRIGDRLWLIETDDLDGTPTGNEHHTGPIRYIFEGGDQEWNGVKPGYVVLAF